MGWLEYHREPGQTDAEHFLAKFTPGTIFHATSTIRNVFYAAVETPDKPGEVWAFLALIYRKPGYFNFGYKDLDETMGPGDLAPAKILDKLTDTGHPTALDWRAKSRAAIAQKNAVKAARVGDTITLAREVAFTNGVTTDTLTIDTYPTRRTRRRCFRVGFTPRVRMWPDWEQAVTRIIRPTGETILTPLGTQHAPA